MARMKVQEHCVNHVLPLMRLQIGLAQAPALLSSLALDANLNS